MLSLFSGIGAFEKALCNIDKNFNLVGFSEIDKWAIESYSIIHGVDKSLNLGDISKIKNENLPKDIDLITYGFPCQDISTAGKLNGIHEGTRSGLLYDAERIIQNTKPKYAIAENVKNLVGKRFINDFNKLLERLNSYGYNNYWKILNAKNYGIPQNRERVFIVSIRKDIDSYKFQFPQKIELTKSFKDYLTSNPYYLNRKDYYKVYGLGAKYRFGGYVKDSEIYNTISAGYGATSGNSMKWGEDKLYRYLNPQESWRLMGFDDVDYNLVKDIVPERQLYRQAGNSIVVNVLEEIFKNLFIRVGDNY